MLTLKGLEGKTFIIDGSSVKIVTKKGKQERTFSITTIAAVETKEPTFFFPGHLRLYFVGGVQPKNPMFILAPRVGADANAVLFKGEESYSIALEMKKYIEEHNKERGSAENVSAADEILKLKALLDDGILTLEEFNAKKRQLLGI